MRPYRTKSVGFVREFRVVLRGTFIARTVKNGRGRQAAFVRLFLLVLFVGGCGDSPAPPLNENRPKPITAQKAGQPSVLRVGSETITCDDIMATPMVDGRMIASLAELLAPTARAGSLEQFKELAQRQVEEVVTSRISEILLYQEAKSRAPDNTDESLEKAVDAEWRRFVLGFGGDEAKAEEVLRRQGIDRQRFREYWKKEIWRESYIASKLPANRPVTYRELSQCYNEMKEEAFVVPAMLKFRLIDIQPVKLQLASVEQDLLEQARKLAADLVARIRAGEEFGELAKQYSHGYWREFGGLWKPVHPDSIAEPYNVLVEAAENIEPGQIAGPIEAQGHVFIMKLEEKRAKGYEPFDKVQGQLERKIIADRRKEAIDKLLAELTEQTALIEKEEFIDVCLERIYRVSNQ